jgi:hypothetical protein
MRPSGRTQAIPGLGLEIGVLLRVRVVGVLHDHIGLRKAGGDVAVDQLVLQQHVGAWVAFAVGVAEG